MKNFLKLFSNKNNLLLITVLLFAVLVRFYNFPNRVTFWSEQARSLIVSANYIKDRPTLLGQEYFRQDTSGHTLFTGALFNYSLIPLIYIFNYEPVPMTGYFALLNLITGLVIYFVVRKMFNKALALVSTTLFLFNDYMIYHSFFIWNYNYLPLVGILLLYALFRRKTFLSGILSGIGISLQFLFAPIALGAFVYGFIKSKKRVLHTFLFALGAVLGNLPMVLFDTRHDFYHARTLTQYLMDTVAGKSDASITYYYFLPFWPVLAIAAGYLLLKIFKINKYFAALAFLVYLYLNLASPKVSFVSPMGMPEGITTKDISVASETIARDTGSGFNVASVLDFDKRAYVLRYFVEYKYGKIPEGVEAYPNASLLYVLGQKDYNFDTSGIWEVASGAPYKVSTLTNVGEGYLIYKLQK